jgi:rhodanese-related sulfurtransferase
MIQFLKKLFGPKEIIDFKKLAGEGALIIDVRSAGEFKGGHVKGAINIPVDSIRLKAADLKKKGKPVITCCRSGARSGMAAGILKQNGIEAFNGGPWNELNNKLQ